MIGLVLLAALVQKVELPETIKGEPGAFVTVRPLVLEGGGVEYYPLDPGLSVFPSSLLVDKTVLVFTAPKPGRYRLLAYTAKGDKPSQPAICTVVIGDAPAPNPGPGPGPNPGPNPLPSDITTDPLYQAFESVCGGLQEPNMKANLAKYAAAWAKAGPQVDGKTLGQWNAAVKAAATAEGLPLGSLAAIRERVGEEVTPQVGNDPAMPLAGDKAKAAVNLAAKFAAIFKKLAE